MPGKITNGIPSAVGYRVAEQIDREKAEADLKQAGEDLAKAQLPEEVDAALDLAKTAETRIGLLGS